MLNKVITICTKVTIVVRGFCKQFPDQIGKLRTKAIFMKAFNKWKMTRIFHIPKINIDVPFFKG